MALFDLLIEFLFENSRNWSGKMRGSGCSYQDADAHRFAALNLISLDEGFSIIPIVETKYGLSLL